MPRPFDAVLFVAFGGPQGPADVRPFLENVLRGRRVAPGRLEEVAHHYELFGGVSPLTELTRRQARGLEARLRASGLDLPVHVGMRNWRPFLVDTLQEMSDAGIRHAIGVLAAAHRSYSSCTQYKKNVCEAREVLARRGSPDVEITYVSDWHTHPGFIAANAEHVVEALGRLPVELQPHAEVIFTAHSIPISMAGRYPYRQQYEDTARLVMRDVRAASAGAPARRYAAVYQSRSGRPEDPWLGPDICDYLRERHVQGLCAAVIAPIGFICDHVEVLYDLDIEAVDVCREIGLPLTRAQAVNDHPRFLEAIAEAVADVCRRYQRAQPLSLVPAT